MPYFLYTKKSGTKQIGDSCRVCGIIRNFGIGFSPVSSSYSIEDNFSESEAENGGV
jgi:hypothetical protein